LSNGFSGCTLDKLTFASSQIFDDFNSKKAAQRLLFYCAKKNNRAAYQA